MVILDIFIEKASDAEVTALMNNRIGNLFSKGELRAIQWLRDNFSLEFESDPNHFLALPLDKRIYYFAINAGQNEALLSLSPRENSTIVNLASFGRIFLKDNNSADGWNYLMALIEQVMIPNRYERMVALIMSKGGLKAFKDLQRNCEGKPYRVDVIPGYPGCSGRVIVDGA